MISIKSLIISLILVLRTYFLRVTAGICYCFKHKYKSVSSISINGLGSIIFLSIIFLFLPTTYAVENTYFVDNEAIGCSIPFDDDYDPSTRSCGSGSSKVYNTIQGAIDSIDLEAGDILEVRAGTYLETVTIGENDSGALGDPVILRARSGEIVNVDGGQKRSRGIIVLASVHDVTIDGFIIDNWIAAHTGDGIIVNGRSNNECQRITVKNCAVNIINDEYASSLSSFGPESLGQMAIHFEYCDECIADNNTITTNNADWPVQTDGFKLGNCDSLIISNNKVTMRNGWPQSDDTHQDCLQMMACANFIAYNNDFESTVGGSTQGFFLNVPNLSNFAAKDYGSVKIFNNIVHGKIANACISVYCDKVGATIKYEIYNNTLFQERDIKPASVGIRISDDYAIVKNNIIRNDFYRTTMVVDNGAQNQGDIDSNIHFANNVNGVRCKWKDTFILTIKDWRTMSGAGTYEIFGDPLLDAEYKITSGSPCRETGSDLSSIFKFDKNNNPRPQGSFWDKGAYQYVLDEIIDKPNPPSSLRIE